MNVERIDPRIGPVTEVAHPAYRVQVWEPRGGESNGWSETTYRLSGRGVDIEDVLTWGRGRREAVTRDGQLVIWVESPDALVRLSGREPTAQPFMSN